MRRRDILAGAGSVARRRELELPGARDCAGHPAAEDGDRLARRTPGLHTSAVRFAQTIGAATGGRIKIEVFRPARWFVRSKPSTPWGPVSPICIIRIEGYFEKKSPAFQFFAAMPFGFTADELFAWVQLRRRPGAVGRAQRPIQHQAAPVHQHRLPDGRLVQQRDHLAGGFKGLRYRMAGPGAEVLRRLGAIVVTLPGGEIMPALKSGAIDASEWIGPWLDMALGLHKVGGLLLLSGLS